MNDREGEEKVSESMTDKKGARLIIALRMIRGVGPAKIVSFIEKMGRDCNRCYNNVYSSFNISESKFKSLLTDADRVIENNTKAGIGTICLLDMGFPEKLYRCKNPVILLYYIGDIDLLRSKTITVIGTRKPDQSFVDKGTILVKKLAEMHYTIVSGLALGCDTMAHESALEFGAPTIAVLPSPCDDIYPKTNRELAEAIVRNSGLLITEYGSGTPFSKFHLTERDRIQSILSDRIIVIQATDDGGSMVAIRRSLNDKKKVFALIGNELKLIHDVVDPCNNQDLSVLTADSKQTKLF